MNIPEIEYCRIEGAFHTAVLYAKEWQHTLDVLKRNINLHLNKDQYSLSIYSGVRDDGITHEDNGLFIINLYGVGVTHIEDLKKVMALLSGAFNTNRVVLEYNFRGTLWSSHTTKYPWRNMHQGDGHGPALVSKTNNNTT